MASEKTNLITDIVFPLCGCIAVGMLMTIIWQMWSENVNAAKAETTGPIEVTLHELRTRDDLQTKRVKLNGAHLGFKHSLIQLEYGTSAAFLVFPTNELEFDPNAIPVIIQDSSVKDKHEAERYRSQTSFTGNVGNGMNIIFKNKDILEACYPGLDLDRCLILSCPPRQASDHTNHVAIGGLVFFGLLFVGFAAWLWFNLRRAFQQGGTIFPEKSVVEKAPDAKPLVYRPDRNVSFRPVEGPPDTDSVTHISSLYAVVYISNIVALASLVPLVPMAFLGKGNVLPDFLMPLFNALLCVTVVSWVGHWLLLLQQVLNPGNDIRKPIQRGTLPGRLERAFAKADQKLMSLGLNPVGDFLKKDNLVEVSREYLSDDGRSVAIYSRRDGIKVFVCYTLLNNGQVIMTIDRALPLSHPMVNIILGVRNNCEKTWVIHKQAADGFEDVSVRLNQNELHDFWSYCNTFEQQMMDKLPMTQVPVPQFQSIGLVSMRDAELI